MSEDRLRKDHERGLQAEALINNELLKDTFDYLERSYIDAWRVCKTPELREASWYLIKAIERVQDHLVTVLNDGILAKSQIEALVRAEESRPAA